MTDKEKELERLHDIVFEGALSGDKYAAMDLDGLWNFYMSEPTAKDMLNSWWPKLKHVNATQPCKNQPETFLDWTETLLERKHD